MVLLNKIYDKECELVYLDVCCLNRPFDDQRQDRIRLEAEAVLLILADCECGKFRLTLGEAAFWEVEAIPNHERREKVTSFRNISRDIVIVDTSVVERSKELELQGMTLCILPATRLVARLARYNEAS